MTAVRRDSQCIIVSPSLPMDCGETRSTVAHCKRGGRPARRPRIIRHMRTVATVVLGVTVLVGRCLPLAAQQPAPAVAAQANRPRPQDTEVWQPVPTVVSPGVTSGAPPSDAIVLF